MEERKQVNASLVAGGRIRLINSKPPYEIEWNQYEKIRMQADEESTEDQYDAVRRSEPGYRNSAGYEIAYRMTENN